MRLRRTGLGIAVAAGLTLTPAGAVETREWTASPAELLRGRADGVAVSQDGALYLAPRTQKLAGALGDGGALEIWSACGGPGGAIFLGTGPDGIVFRTDPNGRGGVFFRSGEAMITALHRLGGGDLLAATSPGGRIYRVDPQGNGRLWAEVEEPYVWAIAETASGSLFVATGDRGRVLKLRSDGTVQPHFDSDEPHIVSLLATGGGLLAGGAGAGRVYEIDVEGNGLVLYDDELDEARALARAEDGTLTVALVGAAPAAAQRPALRLRLPDGTPVGMVEPNVGIEEREGPTLRGFIEGLPVEAEPAGAPRGRLVRLDSDGRATRLWESRTETPLALALDAAGRAVLGTGRPARLYRVESDAEVSRIATFDQGHATALLKSDRTLFAGTSRPAALWRLEAIDAEQGAYLSPAFDAGGPARWGTISWYPAGRLARTEVYTRTGNNPDPDATWSAWSPAQVLADGSPMDSPDGRFAQFRVRFIGTQERDARLGAVTLAFATYNRPPRFEELGPVPAAAGGTARLSWEASDPDGDPLEVVLEYRTAFSADWTTGPKGRTLADGSGTLEWATMDLPEGLYEIRLTVDDGAANAPAEGRRAHGPVRRIRLDRTPPTLETRALADGRWEVVATDDAGRVERLTLLRGEQPVARPQPVDGVADSRRERFEFALPAGPGPWSVRAEDRAGNAARAELPGAPAGDAP